MSSYVNLLQDSEIHFRSMARDKKSLRMAILGAGVAVLAGVLLLLRHFLAVTGEAEELKSRWKKLEPQHAKAKEREEILRSASNRLSELRGWTEARYSIPDFLGQLGDLIPPGMQIISLEWQGFLAGVEGETRMSTPSPAGTPPPPPPTAPQRRNSLLLRALFTGQDSEQKVLNFVESLKSAPFGGDLTNVKLLETAKAGADASVASPAPGKGAPPLPPKEIVGTRFSVDLQFKPRSLQWTKKN